MKRLLLIIILLLVAEMPGYAQGDHGFRFIRVEYEVDGGGGRFERGRGGPGWAHDYPTAEQNFYEALNRTSKVFVEGPPLILKLSDERIFEYPVLYMSEPGFWSMSDEDEENLREYLNRGGFILFDDFRGDYQWMVFYEQMQRIFPGREPVELPPDHPIWSIYYDVDPVEAPSLVSGGFSKFEDRYMAYVDDEGRIVALACHNQDLGDGWEWPDRNLENASTISFQMGINFLVYALTH